VLLSLWGWRSSPPASERYFVEMRRAGHRSGFLHGVASGEPRPDSIILWTRWTPRNDSDPEAGTTEVSWMIFPQRDKEQHDPSAAVASGWTLASPERDFTVKVEARSATLRPRVRYEFRFYARGTVSPTGHFRLPPASGQSLDHLRYAIFSCSDIRWGRFSAYAMAARSESPLDFWVHLGDYFYEYGDDYPGQDMAVRLGLDPAHEVISLEDYRRRHAFYRTDPDLQRLSAAAPLIAIWDDHDVANDVWMHGAENHQPSTEGSFEARKVAAIRAYHEWLPTRPESALFPGKASDVPWMKWRRFDFGDLASLLMLETRLVARTTQAEMTGSMILERIEALLKAAGDPPLTAWEGSPLEVSLRRLHNETDVHRRNQAKRMLGTEQLAWLAEELGAANGTPIAYVDARAAPARRPLWRLVGQPQVMHVDKEPDYEAALQQKIEAGESEAAHRWSATLANLTTVGSLYQRTALPARSATNAAQQAQAGRANLTVTSEVRRTALAHIAAGRYKINLNFDAWTGYVAERDRVAEVLDRAGGRAGDIVIYGGDSHNAWAGMLQTPDGRAVAADFDGMAVSSPGFETSKRWMPPDWESAAWRASNPNLVWTDTHSRGFMLVDLNRSMQHIEYIAVDVGEVSSSLLPDANLPWSECLAAFDVFHPGSTDRTGAAGKGAASISRSSCLPDCSAAPSNSACRAATLAVSPPSNIAHLGGLAVGLGCLLLLLCMCALWLYRRGCPACCFATSYSKFGEDEERSPPQDLRKSGRGPSPVTLPAQPEILE